MANTQTLEQGDTVRTIFGTIETVLGVNGCQVTTYESQARLNWYHIDKVWKIKGASETEA